MFPKARPRRLRISASVRALVQETKVSSQNFIAPLFVTHGARIRNPILSMPGQYQLSIDQVLIDIAKMVKVGIPAVILFGIPKTKNALGSEAYASNGIIQRAIRNIKEKFPKLIVMADLCFCEYTDHGHCGVIKKGRSKNWDVDNDATLRLIKKTALAQARAGVDFIAPSGMMDGAVSAIRQALDKAGRQNVGILAYSAKYTSAFYGPFREAAESTPKFGDRKTYQMNPANIREAVKEVTADLNEGADMVMVKPALSYLDVISAIRQATNAPVVAYNVSGEYSMVKAAEKLGWLDPRHPYPAALEILTSIKRAGADLIITYHAYEAAQLLQAKH